MWILPTLSRPEQCARVLERLKESGCTTRGVIFVNDPQRYLDYVEILFGKLPEDWTMLCGEKNIGALGALNRCFELYPNEPFYGFIGDDEFLLEPNEWDQLLIEAAGDWGISNGVDNIYSGKRAQGYLCIGGKLARTVGYLAMPESWHWYGFDNMWEALASVGACRKIVVEEVKIEHKHPVNGDTSLDECYEIGKSRKDMDYQVYAHWMRTQLKPIVKKIEEAKNAE